MIMELKTTLFKRGGKDYLMPFALVSTLFFLWGFAHSILEVLNPHFQELFTIGKTQAAFVQAAVYGGYFLMALPAGFIIRRWGYKAGVITGLMLYGIGALLFIPGAEINSFAFFVFSLFVIGCGLTCLETSANPYVTVLGSSEGAERRINMAQSLNGFGWILGPLVGGASFFSGGDIATPYTIVGIAVLAVALLFLRQDLPEVELPHEEEPAGNGRLWNISFVAGLIALFLYVAAQTGVNSNFINYAVEYMGISAGEASRLLGYGGMGLFVAGRVLGSWIMKYRKATRLLVDCSMLAVCATAIVIAFPGKVGVAGLLVVLLSESLMYPTIFSLALRSSRGNTKQASSLLVMTIAGGAAAPLLMGLISDSTGLVCLSFLVPIMCYVYITLYSISRK